MFKGLTQIRRQKPKSMSNVGSNCVAWIDEAKSRVWIRIYKQIHATKITLQLMYLPFRVRGCGGIRCAMLQLVSQETKIFKCTGGWNHHGSWCGRRHRQKLCGGIGGSRVVMASLTFHRLSWTRSFCVSITIFSISESFSWAAPFLPIRTTTSPQLRISVRKSKMESTPFRCLTDTNASNYIIYMYQLEYLSCIRINITNA